MIVKIFKVGHIATNCSVVYDENKQGFIIDPAFNEKRLINFIENENIKIAYILLTHGHYDHVLQVKDFQKMTGGLICIHESDREMLETPKRCFPIKLSRFNVKSFVPDKLLKDGQELNVGKMKIKVMHTPGHTKGSGCFFCEDYLFAGDTLFSEGFGRTDLYGGDYETILKSVEKLRSMDRNYYVIPGHEDFFELKDHIL